MTLTALPITSAGRFSPRGPFRHTRSVRCFPVSIWERSGERDARVKGRYIQSETPGFVVNRTLTRSAGNPLSRPTARLAGPSYHRPGREPFLALTPRRCGPLALFQREAGKRQPGRPAHHVLPGGAGSQEHQVDDASRRL